MSEIKQAIPELTLEQCIRRSLPTPWRIAMHLLTIVVAAYLLGPIVGPLFFGFVDPQTTWGRGQVNPVDSAGNWGTLFLIVELLVYTAWIGKQGRKGYDEYQMMQWRKALEGEAEADGQS